MSKELHTAIARVRNMPAELHGKYLGLDQSHVLFHHAMTREKLAALWIRLRRELNRWRRRP